MQIDVVAESRRLAREAPEDSVVEPPEDLPRPDVLVRVEAVEAASLIGERGTLEPAKLAEDRPQARERGDHRGRSRTCGNHHRIDAPCPQRAIHGVGPDQAQRVQRLLQEREVEHRRKHGREAHQAPDTVRT